MNVFKNTKKKGIARDLNIRMLCIALVLIIIGSIGAFLTQMDFGKIDVIGLTIPTENGQWVKADLFKPKTATTDNKAPMVVVIPGFGRTKETQISNSLELARRGIVTIVIDPYGQGDSSSTLSSKSAEEEGYGAIPVIKYISQTDVFNYVDKKSIGVTGHSAGGNAALRVAAYFGKEKNEALEAAKKSDSDGGTIITDAEQKHANSLNRVSSVFISGYVLSLTDKVLDNVNSNVGLSYGYYDEGAYRNENHSADMQDSPEALRMVNSIFNKENKLSGIEIGKMYGNSDNNTLRVVYNEKIDHPLQPFYPHSVSDMLKFFTASLHITTDIPPTNQIWIIKELFNLIALVGAFLFIVPFAGILLRTKAFENLIHNIPEKLPVPGTKGKLILWSTFIITVLIAGISYNPMAKVTYFVFKKASKAKNTWCFPVEGSNSIFLWAILNGVIGLIVFMLTYKLYWKKNGINAETLGIKIDLKEFIKTLGLAVGIFSAFYGLVALSYGIFHTDFRFLMIAVRPLNVTTLKISLMYLPLFFVFYFYNSIRVNFISCFNGKKEWLNMLIAGIENSLGLLFILIIQYVYFSIKGEVFWTTTWLFVSALMSTIPMMFIFPYVNRYLFKKTGKIYLGAMATCLIFVMIMLNNSISHVPF